MQNITVQYNIPRFTVSAPGKQNRACTGDMRLSPGMTEVMEFQYCNSDGVPINLNGFSITLVFWYQDTQYESLAFNMNDNVVLAKKLNIDDPYSGTAYVLLTDQDTLKIGSCGKGSIRWSLFLINDIGTVFPTQITNLGVRYGIVQIDNSGLPNSETIKGLSISITPPTE